jgi:hypothetical protein
MMNQNSSSQSNTIRRNHALTNSQISGLEGSLPTGSNGFVNETLVASRNKPAGVRKESTLTDNNLGILKNMSMLNSYDPNDTKELKIETSNSSVKGNNRKKISVDIKPK